MAASFYATYPKREISVRFLVNKYGDVLYFSRILDVAMKIFLLKNRFSPETCTLPVLPKEYMMTNMVTAFFISKILAPLRY